MKIATSTTKQITALVVTCMLVIAALSIAPLGVVARDNRTEHEPNDQPANATHIKEGVVVTGEVKGYPKDRVDIYAFEAKKGQSIVVNVTGLEEDTQLTPELNGPAYARGNDSTLDEIYATLGTTTNKLGATAPVTGTYYIVIANEAAMGPSGRYAVSVNVSGPTHPREPNEVMATATKISPPTTINAVTTLHESDFYAFDVTAGETITVEFTRTGGTGGVRAILYDSNGNSLTSDTVGANGTVTRTVTAATTGTYYVEISSPTFQTATIYGTGPYTLRVSTSKSQAGPTEIDSCTVIDQPGRYVLTADIENANPAGRKGCIVIEIVNATLDGNGHTIDGTGSGYGIAVRNGEGTVKDVVVSDWSSGIIFELSEGTVLNATIQNNYDGITFAPFSTGAVRNTTIRNNRYGIDLAPDSGSAVIENNRIVSNGVGIVITESPSNQIVNNTIINNSDDGVAIGGLDTLYQATGNVLTGNVIAGNGDSGLELSGHVSDNLYYNNVFNNTDNADFTAGFVGTNNSWNVSKRPGTNIIGGPSIGGNYYAKPGTAKGYSEQCTDTNGDGFCDQPYDLGAPNSTDFLPLTQPTTAPPDNGSTPPDDGSDAPSDDGDNAPPDDGEDAPPSDDGDAPSDDEEDAPPDDGNDMPPEDGGDAPSDDGNNAPTDDRKATVVCEAGSTDEVLGENDEDDDGDGAIDEDDEDTDGPSNDDDDGDGAVDEDDECDDGDDGSDEFNGNAEDDDDGDGAVDEDDEPDSGNSDDIDNDGDGAIDEDDEPDTDD